MTWDRFNASACLTTILLFISAFGAEIAGLAARGLLARLPERVRLTPQGRLLGNQVFAAFLAA